MNKDMMRKHYETVPKETLINILINSREEIERLNKENKELKHKLKLINSYVYGCDIDSLGSDKE